MHINVLYLSIFITVNVFINISADTCIGSDIAHGTFHPSAVIEGSSITVRCDTGFRLEGSWVFKCVFANNKLVLDGELPQCVPLQSGNPTYSKPINSITLNYLLNKIKNVTLRNLCSMHFPKLNAKKLNF